MRRPTALAASLALLAVSSCGVDEFVDALYAPPPDFVTGERVMYSDGLHNENTEMIVLDDRILLIFRGGETGQIGSDAAHILVYASMDQGKTWAKQSEVSAAKLEGMRDIRDPKLVEMNGKLYLYAISRLPGGHYRDIGGHAWTVRAESTDKGVTWTEPEKTFTDVDAMGAETFWGFWRFTKRRETAADGAEQETLYALGYDDGDTQVGMFSSKDGVHWEKRSIVVASYDDVPSEAELQFFGDTAVALVRMDNQGILQDGQSAICTSKDPFTEWECGRRVEQRFDGPTWISRDVEGVRRNFVVARKHLPCTYKRTAIYELVGDLTDPSSPIGVCEIEELPSAGDTAYTAVAALSDGRFLTSWYSSTIPETGDLAWLDGTYAPADIWLAEIDLREAAAGRCHLPGPERACEVPPPPNGSGSNDVEGDFFVSLSPVIYPSQTLLFRARLSGFAGDAPKLELQPLAKETRADAGTAWEATEVTLDGGGRFTARFDGEHVPLEAFPLLEDPFLTLNGVTLRGVVLGPDRLCGSVTGIAQVFGVSPADALDLEGSTFGGTRITGDALPSPFDRCPDAQRLP